MTAIMFMGTGSDVGKSLIVAGLCRHFANKGLRVAPFKPQNMSNNAAAVAEGAEIGRAQALQARAARRVPTVHMNPILLKPEGETGAQVIIHGKRHSTMSARDFFSARQKFMPAILESFARLEADYDLILVEGAGSPAEINLRDGDLANMGFARATNTPAVIIGDIHRGGVIASLVGTWQVLSASDRAMLKGFIVNKFYGEPALFESGMTYIESQTGLPCIGVVPHFGAASKLPAEDSVSIQSTISKNPGGVKICVLSLPRIANFDDLDPLRMENGVDLQFIKEGQPIPGDAALVIIPGSKSTTADLAALRTCGWDIDIRAHYRRGGRILGICGGYQMLGKRIHDPHGLEGVAGSVNGIGLLDIETTLLPHKTVSETSAVHAASGLPLRAYEIHLGKTSGPDCQRPFSITPKGPEGANSPNGRVSGTYLHGCFVSDDFRAAVLRDLGIGQSTLDYDHEIETTLDHLAHHVATHLDTDKICALAN